MTPLTGDRLEKTEVFIKALRQEIFQLNQPEAIQPEQEADSKKAFRDFCNETRQNIRDLINAQKQVLFLSARLQSLEKSLSVETANHLSAQIEIESLKREINLQASKLDTAEKMCFQVLADKELLSLENASLRGENEALKQEIAELKEKAT